MSLLSPGSWFDAEAQSLRDSIDEFGEWFTLVPCCQEPNMPSTPDPSRRSVDFRAVFEREGKMVKIGGEEVDVSSRDPVITLLRCDVPYEIRRADRLKHRITGELFEITNPLKDGLSGIKLDVVQLGRPK